MIDNPLRRLAALGQSVWLDFIRRGMLESGELQQLIEEVDLRGVVSNSVSFDSAVADTHDYDLAIKELVRAGRSAEEVHQDLLVSDIRRAADVLRPVHDRTQAVDGFVGLEVSPHLAHDTEATVAEAARLWYAIARPNAMVLVPATRAGVAAIRQLITDGVNVNATLIFNRTRYREVAEAYLSGLEARCHQGMSPRCVTSVASFCLRPIDVLVDKCLSGQVAAGGAGMVIAEELQGHIAFACARMAYHDYLALVTAERFRRLEERGARPQRLLWAGTGTQDPGVGGVKYVEPLIGPDTVSAMPLLTLAAYRNHGAPQVHLGEHVVEAESSLRRLAEVGIDLEVVAQQLERAGLERATKAFDQLRARLGNHRIGDVVEATPGVNSTSR